MSLSSKQAGDQDSPVLLYTEGTRRLSILQILFYLGCFLDGETELRFFFSAKKSGFVSQGGRGICGRLLSLVLLCALAEIHAFLHWAIKVMCHKRGNALRKPTSSLVFLPSSIRMM